jgi:hypothetical protein
VPGCSTYRTRRSGTHRTWRMPSAMVPSWAWARSPSCRSVTTLAWPLV